MKFLVLLLFAATVHAQGYPDRPVRLITGFPPGGPTDLMARVIGEKWQAVWKQPVVVEARPGASGILSMTQLKAAPPDGYLLLVAPTNTLGVNPHLFPKAGYSPLEDFTLIALVAIIDNVLVTHPSFAPATLEELARAAREKPLTFGSPANGSQAHLAGEFLNQHYGLKMVHVPYKGAAPAMNDLLGGQISMMFIPVATALPNIRAGKLRAVALPARARNRSIADVPTFAEQGVGGFEAATWFMLIGPAGMAPDVTARVRTETHALLRDPEVRNRMQGFGAEPPAAPVEDLTAFLRAELARWGQVVKAAGIKAD